MSLLALVRYIQIGIVTAFPISEIWAHAHLFFLSVHLAPVFSWEPDSGVDLYNACISKERTGPKANFCHLPAFYLPGILSSLCLQTWRKANEKPFMYVLEPAIWNPTYHSFTFSDLTYLEFLRWPSPVLSQHLALLFSLAIMIWIKWNRYKLNKTMYAFPMPKLNKYSYFLKFITSLGYGKHCYGLS